MKKNKISPLGENALTISFGKKISPEANDLVVNLSECFENNRFAGFIETVPAYASVTIFYDPSVVKKNYTKFPTAFDAVKNLAIKNINNLPKTQNKDKREIEIPVNFNKEHALDLEFIARENDLKPTEYIELFISKKYRVYMLGFLPGFAYMGELNENISTRRKATPRKIVPKGSVGIAGRQTGIYPLDSPGGWQIIGKTDIELFTPDEETQTFFQAGDIVKFIPE